MKCTTNFTPVLSTRWEPVESWFAAFSRFSRTITYRKANPFGYVFGALMQKLTTHTGA